MEAKSTYLPKGGNPQMIPIYTSPLSVYTVRTRQQELARGKLSIPPSPELINHYGQRNVATPIPWSY